jgi:dihydrofolate reductase
MPSLNSASKYVASITLKERLTWPNSTLLRGGVADAVAALKAQPGSDLVITGSGILIQTLLPHNLIDEFLLMIHTLVLGSWRRLFPDGSPFATLRLVDTVKTTTDVLIATYQPTSQ